MKVRRWATGLLAGALGIAGAAVAATPAHAAYADPLLAVGTGNLGLTWHAESTTALNALDAAMPNVGVATVLDSANRAMTACNAEELAALPVNPAATVKWCFNAEDATNTTWAPQGLTTSGDADDDGAWGAKRAILSGWVYADTAAARYNDARVAFIDYTNPAAPRYRWVFLVDPNSTGSTYSAAKTHIGGMIWYGDKLIVNAVGNGTVALRVFSMSRILRTTSDQMTVGKVSDGWAAYNYEYVMPQIGYYTYSAGACNMSSDTAVPCFSSISLDRSTSPDSLVTAEYFADQTKRGRMVRYPFGAEYRLPNSATPSQAFRSAVGNQQGVLSFNNNWYLAHSSATNLGQLWGFTPDGTPGRVKTCPSGTGTTTMCWARHPEALTYNYNTGMVWSITEWARGSSGGGGGRVLFGLPLSSLP